MPKIMDTVAKETHGKSYRTYKYSYDSIGIPKIDYEDESDKEIVWLSHGVPAETDDVKKSRNLINLANEIQGVDPLFAYFLDGSRRVFKVDDISYGKRVFPVIAGQVGVGCCNRVEKRLKVEAFAPKVVLVIPDKADADGIGNPFFNSLANKINVSLPWRGFSGISKIISYSTAKQKQDDKFENRAIAKVQDFMIEQEKLMVLQLVKSGCLNQDRYLVKDGSLEYKEMKTGREDLRRLERIKNNYNYVVGVSKQFNPEVLKDYKGKPNANYIAELPLYHRTPVARYKNVDYHGNVEFAVWYVRLHDKSVTHTPFDGVVKVEKIMDEDEAENGIETDLVDMLSANLINERAPVCYGSDTRWANHIYPVYLTERFVKSQYVSEQIFLHMF